MSNLIPWEQIECLEEDLLWISIITAFEETRNIKGDKEQQKGWIYILKSHQYYKIGITADLKSHKCRMKSISPFNSKIIYVQKLVKYKELETYLHSQFKDKKVRGEWFKLSQKNLQSIIKIIKERTKKEPKIKMSINKAKLLSSPTQKELFKKKEDAVKKLIKIAEANLKERQKLLKEHQKIIANFKRMAERDRRKSQKDK